MGWVDEEYEDRVRSRQAHTDESTPEMLFEQAAERRWQELTREIQADVAEYTKRGGSGTFTQDSDHQVRVTDAETNLILTIWADIPGHAIHYDFSSTDARVASPEGGILSIRASRYGRAELYSADQRILSEGVRRMLLEPVMFPPEAAA
jgi:hypothetical protein